MAVGRCRRLRGLAVAAPVLVVAAVDLVARGDRILAFRWYGAAAGSFAQGLRGAHGLAYALGLVLSGLLWGTLLLLAAARPRSLRWISALAFVALFTIALGVQSAFRARWAVYLSRDATELSEHPAWAILGSLRPSASLLSWLVLALALALLQLALARRCLRPTRRARRIASVLFPVSLIGALVLPVSYRAPQSTPPDLLWINAFARAVAGPDEERRGMASVQIRSPRRLPSLQARPERARNVVLILQESQRADVTCSGHVPACPLATPATNDAAPLRLPFDNLRSNASVTTIAMGVLFTGLAPTSTKAELLASPNLFEYAHAAGYDTAYFTSQHLMFANLWLWVQDVPSGTVVLGTHLDPEADMFSGADDGALSRRVIGDWDRLREPFFAVVHYANVHAPRPSREGDGPFRPASEDKRDREAYFNAYRNSVYRSDQAVAELIRHVRSSERGARTVLVYTADHGEAIWEHGQGCDHGCSLFEEDIRVPGWIDAPDGTLSTDEQANLVAARKDYVFHVDVAPTLLDLIGLWDDAAVVARRDAMIGHPLTRAERTVGPVPLSNVARIWERGLPSYGLMQGRWKLIGRHRDPGYACYDVEADPLEQRPLDGDCQGLVPLAGAMFGVPPSAFDRVENHPAWGAAP